jgi:hypothetical protein
MRVTRGQDENRVARKVVCCVENVAVVDGASKTITMMHCKNSLRGLA